MPVLDGMECAEKTKTLFDAFNEKACMERNLNPLEHEIIMRPLLIHLTQFHSDF